MTVLYNANGCILNICSTVNPLIRINFYIKDCFKGLDSVNSVPAKSLNLNLEKLLKRKNNLSKELALGGYKFNYLLFYGLIVNLRLV